MLETGKHIREAAERIENALERCPPDTRRHAELQLAWHHLIDAHSLLTKGRLTPDNLEWASAEATKILEASTQ